MTEVKFTFYFHYFMNHVYLNFSAHQRFVEITVVHHSLRGLEKMRAENKEPPMNMGMMPEYQRLLFACNYRYVREFTKGVESSWTINMVNHFMLASVRRIYKPNYIILLSL